MEFLRFGSSIPGSYWGCCAVCVIQNFNFDPDEKASIQLVDGDCGNPVVDFTGEELFAGPTYRDIFWQRLRIGTFHKDLMPNHVFLAVLTEGQISYNPGKKWLALLKEAGFEFIRTTDNSVYTGQNLEGENPYPVSAHPNYLFGLFRNIGAGSIEDPFTPPKAWTDLPSVTVEALDYLTDEEKNILTTAQKDAHRKVWEEHNQPLLTRKEVEAAGAPVTLAGLRSMFPQQLESERNEAKQQAGAADYVPYEPW